MSAAHAGSQLAFTYDAIPGRVVFGAGSRHRLADELDTLGSRRVLLIASKRDDALAVELGEQLGSRVVGRFADVVQHVPVDRAAPAVELAEDSGADTVVAIGGGSAIGFGKAIALDVEVRTVAMPTTYSGSEMTTIWGKTDGDHKQTGSEPRVKPDVVVYDPELTLSLPPHIAGPSGMNALAHSVEALYGPGANPVISVIALEAMAALHRALPCVAAEPTDLEARTDLLYGAYLAGVALATGGTALHHKACHVLGGMFGLDHGQMNSVVLGHALAYNSPAIPRVIERIERTLGVGRGEAPAALHDLAVAIGAPTSLEAIGMPAGGIVEAAGRVVQQAAANVRPPEEAGIALMLEDAFAGRRPAVITEDRAGAEW